MTRISRRPVKEDVMEKLFILLFESLGKRSNKEEFLNVVYDLFSPTERIMVSKRISIMFLLMKEIDYSTISDILKVSPSTIAKFQIIMENSKGVVQSLEGLLRNEKIVDLFESLILTLKPPRSYGTNWKNALALKNEHERKRREGI